MDCNKRSVGDYFDDRISELPDELLVSILSFLSWKEAARTSLLSIRWRYLWTYFHGKISFREEKSEIEWRELVLNLNRILHLHRAVNVYGFTVVFEKSYEIEDINTWIEFVSNKRVQKFHLRFGIRFTCNLEKDCWTMRTCGRFESLQILQLECVNLSNNSLQYMLSNSPNLESLFLIKLIGLLELSITSSSLMRLKILFVWTCNSLKKITISSGSLEVFHSIGRYDLDIDACKLHTLVFEDHRCVSPSQLIYRLCNYNVPLRQLQTLYLNIIEMVEYDLSDIKNFSLPILKRLLLYICPKAGDNVLNCIQFFQGAATVLHTLEINLYWDGIEEISDKYKMRVNRSIKVVKVGGFLGLAEVDVRLVKILTDNAESIEKLIVAPYRKDKYRGQVKFLPATEEQANDNILQLSENGFWPAKVELVIERD